MAIDNVQASDFARWRREHHDSADQHGEEAERDQIGRQADEIETPFGLSSGLLLRHRGAPVDLKFV